MRNPFPGTLLCLCLSAVASGAQVVPYNDFSGTPSAAFWSPAGLTTTTLPTAPAVKGLRLTPGAQAILLNQLDPGELQFTATGSAGAPLRFTIFKSCDAGATWAAVKETQIGATAVSTDHQIRIVVEDVGNCSIRWQVPADSPSEVLISALQVIPLSQERVTALRQAIDVARLTREAVVAETKAAAVLNLTKGRDFALEVAPELAEIATEAMTVEAMDQFAVAVQTRGNLANPLNYDAFKSLRATVDSMVPPVAQEHLKETTKPLETIFNFVGSVSSGNIMGAITQVMQLGPTIRDLTGTIRTLLSAGTNATD